jgi:bifunctional non-homologous end joining protein LigD
MALGRARKLPAAPALTATRIPRRRSRRTRIAITGRVSISSPERVLYPVLGCTKLELAKLYVEIADWALPHLRGRPLTLVRCEHGASRPDALRSQCQFLRHSAEWHRWVAPVVRRVHIPEQKKLGEYLVIDSLEALIAVLNGDILELHTWNATADRVEQPDRLVFDLDPAGDVTWAQLVHAALLIRDRLATRGLASWVKSTGGKGLHVVVPLEPHAGWDTCFAFSRAFAETVRREAPNVFTTSFGRTLRQGKILIDYKRNYRTSISVAAFSTRARPEASMSVPLEWQALDPRRPLVPYTVSNIRKRIAKWRDDPWRDYWTARQRL